MTAAPRPGRVAAMRFLFRRAPEPDPTHLSVEAAGRRIPVLLRRRPDAKRMTLRVAAATGEVALTVPPRIALDSARRFLEAHAGWITVRLARAPARVPLQPGSVLPLRGVEHRIVHAGPTRAATRAGLDADGAPVVAVSGDLDGIPGRVRRFLAAEATADLREAVGRHAGRLGAPITRLTVRDTRSRWGSCSSAGALSFSWRLILAPPFVLDYLAAHEVAHLKELNHSERFWRLVHELCPRTDEAEGWLKRNGSGLHRYG